MFVTPSEINIEYEYFMGPNMYVFSVNADFIVLSSYVNKVIDLLRFYNMYVLKKHCYIYNFIILVVNVDNPSLSINQNVNLHKSSIRV